MDFSRLDHKDLREIVYSNTGSFTYPFTYPFTYRENKNELAAYATQQYSQAIQNGYVGYVLKAPVVSLDRSVRFPQNSTNKYTKEQIMGLDDTYLNIFLGLYQVTPGPEARRIIYKILELQGFIEKPYLIQPTVQLVPSYNLPVIPEPVVNRLFIDQPAATYTVPPITIPPVVIPTINPYAPFSTTEQIVPSPKKTAFIVNDNEQVIPRNVSADNASAYPGPRPNTTLVLPSGEKHKLSLDVDDAFIETAFWLDKVINHVPITAIPISYPVYASLSPDVIIKKRQLINNYFARFKLMNTKNFNIISENNVSLLIKLYDKLFFNGLLDKLLSKQDGMLNVEFSKATRVAGSCGKTGCDITIKIAVGILQGLFLNPSVKDYTNSGLKCFNRLECLQLTIEHELIHALIELTPDVSRRGRTNPHDKIYSAHGQLFQDLARAYFGHTDFRHELGKEKDDTLEVLHANNLKIGERVFYTNKEKKRQYGRIIKLNPKKAIVKLEDDGRDWNIYYGTLQRA